MNPAPDTHETIILTQDPSLPKDSSNSSTLTYTEMIKRIQSWGKFMLIFGVVYLFSGGEGINSWGIALLLSGALTFLFKTRDIFVLNAVIIFWAALSNITSGNIFWILFSLTQVYVGIKIFKDFNLYKETSEKELSDPELENIKNIRHARAEKYVPLFGFFSGLIAFIAFVSYIACVFYGVLFLEGNNVSNSIITGAFIFFQTAQTLSMLAFSMSLSALLCKYPKILLSILGLISSSLILLFCIIFYFLAM